MHGIYIRHAVSVHTLLVRTYIRTLGVVFHTLPSYPLPSPLRLSLTAKTTSGRRPPPQRSPLCEHNGLPTVESCP